MTAIGPAGLAIIAFVGAISLLTAAYTLEQIIRRSLGAGDGR